MDARVVYVAKREKECICGSMKEIANYTGEQESILRKSVERNIKTEMGWKVSRLYRIETEYLATNPNDDDIIGPLEEVACLMGFSERYVKELAQKGSKSRSGWSVRRLYNKIKYEVA